MTMKHAKNKLTKILTNHHSFVVCGKSESTKKSRSMGEKFHDDNIYAWVRTYSRKKRQWMI